jgi:thiamine biosynthesis lipoprotein
VTTALSAAPAAGGSFAPAATGSPDDVSRTFRSMASDVTLRIVGPGPGAGSALDRAEQVVARVATSCTRFDPASPLMRANAAPRRWHEVPAELYDAVTEAHAAYLATGGLFDPRVLETLLAWGDDGSLAFRSGDVAATTAATKGRRGAPHAPRAPGRRSWQPRFDATRRAVRLGPVPVDLGGIGKGLAVRWAAQQLRGHGSAALVEAGGDLQALGSGPDGTGWRVAVEDPRGGTEPVAVLQLHDLGCATSSIRLRRWTVDGREVHHLVDPRTGEPADSGLLSVTVVGADAALAEVWSKALFLAGRGRVRQLADEHGVAALLVDTDGVVGVSRAMRPHLLWQADRGW